MAKIQVTNYTNTKEILKYDHYISETVVLKAENGSNVEGKIIVKAGTILPTNDEKARGVLLYDVDVTNGEQQASLVIHGFVDKAKLPVQPSASAVSAIPLIKFI